MIKNDEIYRVDELFKCDCDSHYLRVTQFHDEDSVYFVRFSSHSINIFGRIKLAIGYIFQPSKFDMNDGVILDTNTIHSLIKTLFKTLPQNPNIFFGDK